MILFYLMREGTLIHSPFIYASTLFFFLMYNSSVKVLIIAPESCLTFLSFGFLLFEAWHSTLKI